MSPNRFRCRPRNHMLLALALSCAPAAFAQKATEMYVPIGQSAGLSGKYTLQAQIQAVNTAERSLTLVRDGSSVTVKLTAGAPVWIDRSKQQRSNSTGTLADARPGMLAEVKYVKNNLAGGEAEWVKLQSAP